MDWVPVCLWLTDTDFHKFGRLLSIAYNELVNSIPGADLTDRLRQRRGVMTINGFYSYVLGTGMNAEEKRISEDVWRKLDHSCLATAVNGEVFRDDLGIFTLSETHYLITTLTGYGESGLPMSFTGLRHHFR